MPCYLPVAWVWIVGFIPFSRLLALWNANSLVYVWTWVTLSISYDGNHYVYLYILLKNTFQRASAASESTDLFVLKQLQEKCQEQNRGLYVVFVDLTRTFDKVSRERNMADYRTTRLSIKVPEHYCPAAWKPAEIFLIINGVKHYILHSLLHDAQIGCRRTWWWGQSISDTILMVVCLISDDYRLTTKIREQLIWNFNFADDATLVKERSSFSVSLRLSSFLGY